jgi:flagellar motor switch protein FliM
MAEVRQGSEGAARAAAEMSSEEVAALLERGGSPAGGARRGEARPYDLAGRERIVRGTMPALDRINERWVGEFQQEVAERVRRGLEMSVANVELTPYADWLAPLPAPSSLNLLAVEPWGGNALIAVEGPLLFGLVEAFYGGSNGAAAAPARATLGRAEERFNRLLVDALIKHFQAAFRPVAALELEYQRTELNPHYATIATPSEIVLVTKIDITLGEVGGALHLVVPISLLDPVRERLDEQLRTASADTRAKWHQSMRDRLAESGLDLTGVFFEGRITMKELLRLKSGDIWPIEMPKTAVLRAGGVPLLRGKFGKSRGYNAIKIVEAVQRPGRDASRSKG